MDKTADISVFPSSLRSDPVDAQASVIRDELTSLALTTASLFAQGNAVGASATFDRLVDTYVAQMRQPLSRAWSSLPPLDLFRPLMEQEFLAVGGAASKVDEFGKAAERRIRAAFEAECPRLREININHIVGLETMRECVGNLMHERDKKAQELATNASGVLGRIRSRFVSGNGGSDFNATFMANLQEDTFAHAVAHTANAVARKSLERGSTDQKTLDEVTFLANVAVGHAPAHRHDTQSLISDVRWKATEIHSAMTSPSQGRTFG